MLDPSKSTPSYTHVTPSYTHAGPFCESKHGAIIGGWQILFPLVGGCCFEIFGRGQACDITEAVGM